MSRTRGLFLGRPQSWGQGQLTTACSLNYPVKGPASNTVTWGEAQHKNFEDKTQSLTPGTMSGRRTLEACLPEGGRGLAGPSMRGARP